MVRTPLDSRLTNIGAFIRGLFDVERGRELLRRQSASIDVDQRTAWLIEKAEQRTIVRALEEMWRGARETPVSDRSLIDFLREFIISHQLMMHVPTVEMLQPRSRRVFKRTTHELPVYRLTGYEPHDLTLESGVRQFLQLILAGAHFVVIHSAVDGQDEVPDFTAEFKRALPTSSAIGHSHYTWFIAPRGRLYPHVVTEPRPLINSLLVDYTAKLKPNSLMQLEGWPLYRYYRPFGGDGRFKSDRIRHLGDFDAHRATKWNISTFGASVYSEKRGTTVFLAREGWQPKTHERTIMAPYQGCRTRQRWLDTDLIRV